MKCRECEACKKGYFKSRPDTYVCTGVKHPFVIEDIDVECTEYPEYRNREIRPDITYKQTKEQFLLAWNSNAYLNMCESDDMKNAIVALDKQIPKKPSGDLHSVPHYRCPSCHNAIVVYEYDYKYPNCKWCGQAIDWSKNERED